MKFIKTHLVSLICALVVVLALAWYFWVVGNKQDELQKGMADRLAVMDTVAGFGKVPINIPGATSQITGVVTQDAIDAKTTVQDRMRSDADQIAEMASVFNETGRVVHRDEMGHLVKVKVTRNMVANKKGVITPGTVMAKDTVIPLLDGNEEPHYLPVVANGTDPNDFYDHYAATFNRWLSLLVTGSATAPPELGVAYTGAPPSKEDVDRAWQEEQHQQIIKSGGIAALQQGLNQTDFTKNYICAQAAKIRMYVTRDSFQRRSSTKNEQEIFDALVDCWLQADVIHAIDIVNSDVLKALPPEEQNVGHSPIKKLEHITVGFGQLGGSGGNSLFSPGGHAGLDYTQSMTGRTGNAKYDVSSLQINMDIDPSYLNKFIDKLYQQNNSYTILNIKMATVDPYAAASNGYIYGHQQVVSVSLQVEVLLYRGWTDAILPAVYKNQASTSGHP